MEQRHFCQASLEYVFRLQEVHERKKFEFVETVICNPFADIDFVFFLFLVVLVLLHAFLFCWCFESSY